MIGLDCTADMLHEARAKGRDKTAGLVQADARRLPLPAAAAHAVFAAGLLHHLPDHAAGLAELARVTRPGGRLVLFHPTGVHTSRDVRNTGRGGYGTREHNGARVARRSGGSEGCSGTRA